MQDDSYDALIIGSGQGGVPLAKAYAKAGKRVALIERAQVGGSCVNYGCTPSKTMAHVAKVTDTVRRAAQYGVHTAPPVVNLHEVHALKTQIVQEFRSGTEKSLLDSGVKLIRGDARFVGPKQVAVQVDGPDLLLHADLIFIDTGVRPFTPSVPGLDRVQHFDSRSIMDLQELPRHLIVIGGGYIGLEFGQMFARYGSKVSIIEESDRLLPREDPEFSEEIARILKDQNGIEIFTDANVRHVSSEGAPVDVHFTGGSGARTVTGTHLLIAAGQRPNTECLNLHSAGIEADEHGYIEVNERLETTAPGVFAIGDVKGAPAFTHISYDDYRILKANLLDGGQRTISGRLVPYCMFIDPQFARVGLSESEAKAKGIAYRAYKLPLSQVSRAAETQETEGLVKAVVDTNTGRILGASVLAPEGGEIMAQIELAMMGGLTASTLANAIFAHPTYAELWNNLFS